MTVLTMMMALVTSVEYQVDNTSEHPASLPATILLSQYCWHKITFTILLAQYCSQTIAGTILLSQYCFRNLAGTILLAQYCWQNIAGTIPTILLPQYPTYCYHNISIQQYCQHNTTHIVSTISTILPFRTIFHILLPQYPLYCWHKIYSFADNAQIDPFHNTSFISHLYCQACLAPPYTSATISCHKIIGLPCFTVSLSLMILLPKDLTAKLIITTEMPFLNTPDTLGGNCQNCRQLPDGEEQDASNLSLWSHFIKCLTFARGCGFCVLTGPPLANFTQGEYLLTSAIPISG